MIAAAPQRSAVTITLALVLVLVLVLGTAACGGGTQTQPPMPAIVPVPVVVRPSGPDPGPVAREAAAAIAHAYDLLATESAVAGDPAALRTAAVEALAPKGWKAAPIAWANDPTKDSGLLHDAVLALATRGELPADAVIRAAHAMALATDDAQTFALAKPAVQALFALIDGGPVVQPGMVEVRLEDGRWAVRDVLAGGAAAVAGVQRGDVLVSLDGAPISHGYLDFAPLLGAAPGLRAKLVVERAGANRELDLALVAVASPIVESRVERGVVGYIRIWACTHSDDPARDAAQLVVAALAALDAKRVKQLVLDLRGNVGGFPFDIASLLVDADPLMYALGADGADQPVPRTKLAAARSQLPIAVLVDEQTSSGAEMIALALRDHRHAILVGRPTAGGLTFPTTEKLSGEVTLSYPLSRVASAKTKAVLDGNRLVPDLAIANPTAAEIAAGKDPQLEAAFAALRTVPGKTTRLPTKQPAALEH